jgi:hypothetical protein
MIRSFLIEEHAAAVMRCWQQAVEWMIMWEWTFREIKIALLFSEQAYEHLFHYMQQQVIILCSYPGMLYWLTLTSQNFLAKSNLSEFLPFFKIYLLSQSKTIWRAWGRKLVDWEPGKSVWAIQREELWACVIGSLSGSHVRSAALVRVGARPPFKASRWRCLRGRARIAHPSARRLTACPLQVISVSCTQSVTSACSLISLCWMKFPSGWQWRVDASRYVGMFDTISYLIVRVCIT